jgi:hypothetical protein
MVVVAITPFESKCDGTFTDIDSPLPKYGSNFLVALLNFLVASFMLPERGVTFVLSA